MTSVFKAIRFPTFFSYGLSELRIFNSSFNERFENGSSFEVVVIEVWSKIAFSWATTDLGI